nr:hypothetical protein [uncultured Halomonas sp.]
MGYRTLLREHRGLLGIGLLAMLTPQNQVECTTADIMDTLVP